MSELYHYGVLGMKWGVRHDKDYQYTSRLTKKYKSKANKYRTEGDIEAAARFDRYAKRSSELDKRDLDYAKRVKTSGNIASKLLLPVGVGSRSYQRTLSVLNGHNEKGITTKKLGAAALTALGTAAARRIGAAVLSTPLSAIAFTNPVVGLGAHAVAAIAVTGVGQWAVGRIASRIYVRGKDK